MKNTPIKIRPINNDTFVSSERRGFMFNTDIILPPLSDFELLCIKIDKSTFKKSRNKKYFWLPDVCFYGTAVSINKELYLLKSFASNDVGFIDSVNTEFNRHFEFPKHRNQKYYYYERLSILNMPAYYFVAGLRFVASIVKQWQSYVQHNEFFLAEKLFAFIIESGIINLFDKDKKHLTLLQKTIQHYDFIFDETKDDFKVSIRLNIQEDAGDFLGEVYVDTKRMEDKPKNKTSLIQPNKLIAQPLPSKSRETPLSKDNLNNIDDNRGWLADLPENPPVLDIESETKEPLVAPEKEKEVEFPTPIVSRPFIDMSKVVKTNNSIGDLLDKKESQVTLVDPLMNTVDTQEPKSSGFIINQALVVQQDSNQKDNEVDNSTNDKAQNTFITIFNGKDKAHKPDEPATKPNLPRFIIGTHSDTKE